jgi:hypothetical protein
MMIPDACQTGGKQAIKNGQYHGYPTVIPGIEDADIKPIAKIENSQIKQKKLYTITIILIYITITTIFRGAPKLC